LSRIRCIILWYSLPPDEHCLLVIFASPQFLVEGAHAEAYLLAVSFEGGIVDFSRVGAIQVVPDALQRLFPVPAVDGSGLHGECTGWGDRRIENLA
jgi:hypothetical protein